MKKDIYSIGKHLISYINIPFASQHTKKKDDAKDFHEILRLAKMHGVENILYYALIEEEYVPIQVLAAIKKLHEQATLKSVVMEAESISLCEMLESLQVKHCFLKGSILKRLYPKEDMRSMVDVDILIEKDKRNEVKQAMIELGYTVGHLSGNHDVYFKKPYMNVEMHHAMMHDIYEISKYYKDIWSSLKQVNSKEFSYEMLQEDFYIYMMVHNAKHFSNSGIGIRSILDVLVYLKHYEEQMDFVYIRKELAKLGLLLFEENMLRLMRVWFLGSNEVVDRDLESYIIESGTHGILKHKHAIMGFMGVSSIDRFNRGKYKYLFRLIFPTFFDMKMRNPILKKVPILLPWFYITRLVSAVLFKRKLSQDHLVTLGTLTKEEVERINAVQENSGFKGGKI